MMIAAFIHTLNDDFGGNGDDFFFFFNFFFLSSSEKRKVAKGKIVVDERTFFTGERQTSLSLLVVKFLLKFFLLFDGCCSEIP